MNSSNLTSVQGKQQGYTLVELAISVAILSVLIVAGLLGVQSILNSGKVNDQIKTVAKLTAKSSALFASAASGTTGITTQQMLNLGGWDASKSINGNITSSFGGQETMGSNNAKIGDMPPNVGFIYKINAVPQAACADLANGISGFVYALHIKEYPSLAAPVDWVGESSVVKAPGTTNVNRGSMATACSTANPKVDFYMALKP